MKARSLTASFLLAAALGGCDAPAPVPSEAVDAAPVVDLPERHSTVSGLLFDPEAFFVQLMSFPVEPGHEDEVPPPALFDGTPYLVFSSISGAQVRLSGPGLSASTSAPSSFSGHWQVDGVALSDATPYLAEALPPAAGVEFPLNNEAPVPVPAAAYYPTTHLRPIQVNANQCMSQTALMVGSAGALDAVAQHLTAQGTATTVADLMDPAKTGGVVLLWVHMPSFFFDFFLSPMDSVAGEASAGRLVALDWAPVDPEAGAAPGQSPMGFSVLPDPMSMIGYFALVLPPGVTEPVTVSFTDTFTTPPGQSEDPGPSGMRPLQIPPAVVEPRAGVSVQRVFAIPNFPPEEQDPLADPGPPPPDFSWRCEPPPPAE